MTSVIEGLKPENIWKHFETLTKIPRPSKHEEKILKYLRNFATRPWSIIRIIKRRQKNGIRLYGNVTALSRSKG